jgi:hypothetical protein
MLVFDDADGTPPPAVVPPVPSDLVQVRSAASLALPVQRQAGGAFRLTVIT